MQNDPRQTPQPASKRSARLKMILSRDPAFTNVLVGILMLFYQSLWIVILYDSGKIGFGDDFWWDLQLISITLIILLTAPFLLASLFLASSMTDTARRIVGMCSVFIAVSALVFTAGFVLESGGQFSVTHLFSRLPWTLFGIFVVLRIPMLKTQLVQE